MEKRKLYFLLLLAVTLCVQACDPARVLVLKTSAAANTSVTIYGHKSLLPGARQEGNEKITLTVPVGTVSDTTLFYGIGGWHKTENLPAFVQAIDSIIIVNTDHTLRLDTKEKMTDYLLSHRSGFAKRKLTIKAK